jgi:nicotinate-nucleotide adenylyltransferase
MTRLGILGGTFDPPHLAHLIAGECAVSEFALDKLLYIPANMPPNKLARQITPAAHRLAMTKLAIEGNPRFDISDIELKREGPSYAIDTIRELKKQFSVDELFLFIGLDQFAIFESWRKTEEILDEAKVVVISRPTKNLGEIDSPFKDLVTFFSIPLLDISSTDIRGRVRDGKPIRYLVQDAVEEYINSHRLYQ